MSSKDSLLLICSGSVASIKCQELRKELSKKFDVTLMLTKHAKHFTRERPSTLRDGATYANVIIAPCSANLLARLALGHETNFRWAFINQLVDQLPYLQINSLIDSCERCIVSLAMNTHMLCHPLTAWHVNRFDLAHKKQQVAFLRPSVKKLMCDDVGIGGLPEIDEIVSASGAFFSEASSENNLLLHPSEMALICSPYGKVHTPVAGPGADKRIICANEGADCLFVDSNSVLVANTMTKYDNNKRMKVVCPYENEDEWPMWRARGDTVLHIELARQCHSGILFIDLRKRRSVNLLEKIATGVADDLVSCVARAWPFPFKVFEIRTFNGELNRELSQELEMIGFTVVAATKGEEERHNKGDDDDDEEEDADVEDEEED